MSAMKPSIVITGANGFTGMHACRHFAERGMRVIAVMRSKRRPAFMPPSNCETVSYDLAERDKVKELLRTHRPDYLLHLAGKNDVKGSWADPVDYMEINMMATLYLLDALRTIGHAACRVLIAGSMLNFPLSDTPKPPHPYSFSKTFQVLAAHCWHQLYNQPILIAQPSNLVGPGPSNGICGLLARYTAEIEKGKKQSPFILSSSAERRDFIDVRDAVAAYERILLHGRSGEVYQVGSGKLRTLGEAASVLQNFANCPIPLQINSNEVQSQVKPVDLTCIHALGWRQQISFQQSLQGALDYFRACV